ncbi:MAG: alpha/beta hydrolase [Propionibacteriaceae bacterium]
MVTHRYLDVDGCSVFYRDAGPRDAPVLLLPHGYPCSSYEFRHLMPRLADRWRLLAPDFPGCGYSDTPDDFTYTFDGYADFLHEFLGRLGVARCVVWLHDFGSQIGLRLAIAHPELIAGLIIQNGDIYSDQLGPGYAPLQKYWDDPSPERRAELAASVSEDGYREEFCNDLSGETLTRLAPDLWQLHWSLTTPRRREIATEVIAGLRENLAWFPRYQKWLRDHQPPALIVWGPRDRYMPAGAAQAYLRDLPDAELHLFDDGGHWLLETHLDEVVPHVRSFLTQVWPGGARAE